MMSKRRYFINIVGYYDILSVWYYYIIAAMFYVFLMNWNFGVWGLWWAWPVPPVVLPHFHSVCHPA